MAQTSGRTSRFLLALIAVMAVQASAKTTIIPKGTRDHHLAQRAGKEPIDTYYIRNGKTVGHKLGYMNETYAQRNALIADLAPVNNSADAINFNINLDISGTSIGVLATVICIFVPNCLSYVANNLRSAGVSAIGAGGAEVTVGEPARRRRGVESYRRTLGKRGMQYEGFACEYGPSDVYCLDSSDYLNPALQTISEHDVSSSSASSGVSQSSWTMTSVSGGDTLAMLWHCIGASGECSLNDNGPTAVDDIGNDPY